MTQALEYMYIHVYYWDTQKDFISEEELQTPSTADLPPSKSVVYVLSSN